jgi:hypothetical protein
MRKALAGASLLVLGVAVAPALAQDSMDTATHFKVRIENISNGNVLRASTGGDAPFAISPGVWAVHTKDAPVFTAGQKDRGKGLEAQAEDGNPAVLAESLKHESGVISVGAFTTPEGAGGPAPAGPGQAFEFAFDAKPGSRLTFTSMFGQSNDLFYAPADSGIALFDKNKRPLHGDITWLVMLWDAGTEVNQEPGFGPDQAPRQKAPNTGAAEHGVVQPIEKVKDGFHYPSTRDVLRVTITPQL